VSNSVCQGIGRLGIKKNKKLSGERIIGPERPQTDNAFEWKARENLRVGEGEGKKRILPGTIGYSKTPPPSHILDKNDQMKV